MGCTPGRVRGPLFIFRKIHLYGKTKKSTHGHQTTKPSCTHFERGPVPDPARRRESNATSPAAGRRRVEAPRRIARTYPVPTLYLPYTTTYPGPTLDLPGTWISNRGAQGRPTSPPTHPSEKFNWILYASQGRGQVHRDRLPWSYPGATLYLPRTYPVPPAPRHRADTTYPAPTLHLPYTTSPAPGGPLTPDAVADPVGRPGKPPSTWSQLGNRAS